MIRGLGVDVEEVARIRRALRARGARFTGKLLSERERERFERTPARRRGEHLAGRYAAKEAVLKAIGTGWDGGIAWTEIEIVPDSLGRPEVALSGQARAEARKRKIRRIRVAITHTKSTAMAMAIAES